LREKLGDSATTPTYVETLPGRGYRFIGKVEAQPNETPQKSTAGDRQPLPERPTSHRKYLRWYVLLIALAVVAVSGVIVMRVKVRPQKQTIKKRITANSPEAAIRGAVISPDGKYLAYAQPNEMYVRQLDTGEVRRLALPREINVPVPSSWFPDSTDLVFSCEWSAEDKHARSVWRLSILGG